ncbi:MAG: DUF5681 domain-containing protein [Veillonellales bacterium]
MIDSSTEKQTKTEKYPNRWKKGVTGNPKGRPRKPEAEMLREALERAKEKHNGIHLIEHAVDLAYHDNNVLIAILKKILPDQLKGEGFGAENYFNLTQGIPEGELRGLIETLRSRFV